MRRPGFLGGVDVSSTEASALIQSYKTKLSARKAAKDFSIWASMYALPKAKSLYQDPYKAVQASLDPGAKAVAEVKKVSEKLVKVKKEQEKLAVKAERAVAKGDIATATEVKKAEVHVAKKAKVIENQLATRVDEGVKLAKAKRKGERAKAEVDIKKQVQAKKYPHLTNAWAKHDALYSRIRNQAVQKHKLSELKDAQIEQYLKTLPKSVEKDAKIERHRKTAAARRVTQAQEVSKIDSAEAGRVDGREKTAK